jgi:preprotein translocase subunit SecG
MNILIWLFTFLLVVDCLVLILLVLIQLPKKEAGMGQAFGGGATDALFGAGSGTALTKLTKYTAGIFFVMTLLISMLHGHQARARSGDLRNILTREEKESAITPAARTNAANTAATNNTLINATTGAVTRITNTPLAPK